MTGIEMKPNFQEQPPPPPYMAPYPPPPVGTTVITTGPPTIVTDPMFPGPMVIISAPIGSNPTRFICKSCHADIVTRVVAKPSTRTHLFAALLCIIGCWPCVCVPYCMDSCMNADHYCPNCNAYIGTYQP